MDRWRAHLANDAVDAISNEHVAGSIKDDVAIRVVKHCACSSTTITIGAISPSVSVGPCRSRARIRCDDAIIDCNDSVVARVRDVHGSGDVKGNARWDLEAI